MESVVARVLVMVVVGIIGGAVAILFVRAESEQRKAHEHGAHGSDGTGRTTQEGLNVNKQIINNQSLSRDTAKTRELPDEPKVSASYSRDIAYLRQQLPLGLVQSERRILAPSERAQDVLDDGGFLDELLLAIRRRLLSVPEDVEKEEEEEGGKRRGGGGKQTLRREKRYDLEMDEWQGLGKDDPGVLPGTTEEVGDEGWPESIPDRHHIRHSRRKNHHRRYKTTPPSVAREEVETLPRNLESQPKAADVTVAQNPSSENSIRFSNRVNGRFDNLTNVIIMGNITHIKTPHDVIEDDNLMAAELREALLLAVPLSLLLTVILLICVAFCCCRFRNHPVYSEHLSYAYREDDEYGEECPNMSSGMCDACLPDISYQAHQATKIKKGKKRRPSDQIELVLGSESMDCGPHEEGLECHPPLYTLLSNLPPGSSLLEEDYRRESPFRSFRPSLPRRSQSLEFLTV